MIKDSIQNNQIVNKRVYDIVVLQFVCILLAFSDIRPIFIFSEVIFFIGIFFLLLKTKIFSPYYLLWSILFLMLCFLSLLWAKDEKPVFVYSVSFIQTSIIGVLLISSYLINWNKIRLMLNYFTLGSFLMTIRIIIETPTYMWGKDRVGGIGFFYTNVIALNLALAAICSLYLSLKSKKRVIYYLITLVFFVAIIFSGSRLPLAIVCAGFILLLLLNNSRMSNKLILIPIIAVFTYYLYTFFISNPFLYSIIGSRIEGFINIFTGSGIIEASAYERYNLILLAINMFEKHPLLGYGLGNFKSYNPFGLYAHNNYLEIATGVGIIGCAIYYSLHIYIIKKLVGSKLKESITFLAIILVLLLSDLAAVTYVEESFQIMLVICYAVCLLKKENNEEIKK